MILPILSAYFRTKGNGWIFSIHPLPFVSRFLSSDFTYAQAVDGMGILLAQTAGFAQYRHLSGEQPAQKKASSHETDRNQSKL